MCLLGRVEEIDSLLPRVRLLDLIKADLLDPVYVGDKSGGVWLSPTSRLGTGGFLHPCVWPSDSPPLGSR